MASVRITIKTDNAAFYGNPPGSDQNSIGNEVARILCDIAGGFAVNGAVEPFRQPVDHNGNTVGTVEIIDEEGGGE